MFAPQAPRLQYLNDFESPTSDFTGPLFRIGTEPGFAGSAIHSPHPYANNTNPIYLLTVPIRVAHDDAIVSFDEVALVEPGEPGSVFGDPSFYDYVVVEGTLDGKTWTPDRARLGLSRVSGVGSGLRRQRAESVAAAPAHHGSARHVRQRRSSFCCASGCSRTPGPAGWGWIIDNLEIQSSPVIDVGDPRPSALAFALEPSVPNPVRGRTVFAFSLPAAGQARLSLYDVSGRLVQRLVDGSLPAGRRTAEWDGRDAGGSPVPAGVYFCELASGAQRVQRKLVVAR